MNTIKTDTGQNEKQHGKGNITNVNHFYKVGPKRSAVNKK